MLEVLLAFSFDLGHPVELLLLPLALLLELVLEYLVRFNALEIGLLLYHHLRLLAHRAEVHRELCGELALDDWRDVL